jgi:capsular exopolysaccharide synthesis family protein
MLADLANGRLAETVNYERELRGQYQDAAAEAARLEDQMVELSLIDHDIELLRNLHDTLANRIADLGIWQNKADIRIEPVSHPAALDRPVAPRLGIVAACCALGGLGAGTFLVYVVDLLDDRYRSPHEISEQLGLPVLGVIHRLPGLDAAGAGGVHVHVAPDSIQSESFHSLRTTLALISGEHPRIAVTSSEPGDGKTTVLANLAASIARAGRRVLLIDADMRRPGLRKLFESGDAEGLSDVLRSREELRASSLARIRSTGIERLDLLPAGPKPADPAELLSRPRFADLVGWAETQYDFVLVDCPPALMGGDAAIVGRVMDSMLLLVQPEKNHRRVVVRTAESLLGVHVRIVGVVVNRMADDEGQEYHGYSPCSYGYHGAESPHEAPHRKSDSVSETSFSNSSRAA